MAFLDKLGSLAKNLGDKTNEAIAMSKLNGKITSEKALAETELRKIGEYYYGQFLSGGQIEPEILEACQSAKAHYRPQKRYKSVGSKTSQTPHDFARLTFIFCR